MCRVGGDGLRHTVPQSLKPWRSDTYSYRLPSDVTCEKCTLQYVWQTSSWDGASGEQFQNCADISITPSGAAASAPDSEDDGAQQIPDPKEPEAESPQEDPVEDDAGEPEAGGNTETEPVEQEEKQDVEEDGDVEVNEQEDIYEEKNVKEEDEEAEEDEEDTEEAQGEPDVFEEQDDAMEELPTPAQHVVDDNGDDDVNSDLCDMKVICATPGLKPAPCGCDNKCTSFVKCAHGRGWQKYCPAGTMFNPEVINCDWSHNVKCTC